MEQNYLEHPFNMGAFLHDRQLAVVPGTFSEMVNGNNFIKIAQCVPYNPAVTDRTFFTFWTFKQLNRAGEYDEFLSVVEEKLL